MSKKSAKTTPPPAGSLKALLSVLYGLPIVFQVTTLALANEEALRLVPYWEGGAKLPSQEMLEFGLVAGISLFALVGEGWARRLAPFVYLAATISVTISAVMGDSPFYWLPMLAYAICSYELFVSKDLAEFQLNLKVNSPPSKPLA